MKPPTEPLLAAFAALARGRPDTPIVDCGGRRLTTAELADIARSYEGSLRGNHLQPGDIVGLSAAGAPGFLAGLLALRTLGCAVLLLESSSPRAEKGRIARAMGARGILEVAQPWPRDSGDPLFLSSSEDTTCHRLDPEIAVIKLTSGTTGKQRGILTRSESLMADEAALAASMDLGRSERILAVVPLSHSYGLSSIAMPALVRGSTIVMPDNRTPVGPMLAMESQQVSFLPTVPASLRALVKLSSPPPLPRSLRLVISAGAPLSPATALRFREIFGQPVHVFYGSSECGGICYDREGSAGEEGTVGTPVEGVHVTLDEGLVTVESRAVACGYHPQPGPELENGRFRSHDLGRWDNGRLRLCGRSDDLINVRGKMINPREVEEVLARHHGVEEAAVLGGRTSGGAEILRAVVACDRGSVDKVGLRAWCRLHLIDYKVPRSLILVERLPRTERGKLDRAALDRLANADDGS